MTAPHANAAGTTTPAECRRYAAECLRAIQFTMSEPVKAALLANGPARRRDGQLAALRLIPFRSATFDNFLSAAFPSLRFVVRSRTRSVTRRGSFVARGLPATAGLSPR